MTKSRISKFFNLFSWDVPMRTQSEKCWFYLWLKLSMLYMQARYRHVKYPNEDVCPQNGNTEVSEGTILCWKLPWNVRFLVLLCNYVGETNYFYPWLEIVWCYMSLITTSIKNINLKISTNLKYVDDFYVYQ